MKERLNSNKNNILVTFFSNPEYITPIFNMINLLSDKYNVVVVHRNVAPLNYKYENNIKVYSTGKVLGLGETKHKIYNLMDFVEFIFKIRKEFKKDKIG